MSETAPPTLRQLQSLIPRHLRQIEPVKSLAYLAFSLAVTAALALLGWYVWPQPSLTSAAAVLLWLPLSLMIGLAASGLWVLGHECGHGTFIRPVWLEQALGLLLHTFFLAPYFSWRRTHQMHHLRTNHLGEDIAYVPFAQGSAMARWQGRLRAVLGDTGFNVMFQCSVYLLGFPAYLCFGLPGKMAWVSHFLPINRAVYPTTKLRWLVALNTVLYFTWLSVVIALTLRYPAPMTFLYIIPLLEVNFWLLFYTLHHHASPHVPWYSDAAWTPARGAFAVIDRPYWPLVNLLHHNIGRYHVYHHICSNVPHYHGKAVTQLIKARYPQFYVEDPVSPWRRTWEMGRIGLVVQRDDGDRFWLA